MVNHESISGPFNNTPLGDEIKDYVNDLSKLVANFSPGKPSTSKDFYRDPETKFKKVVNTALNNALVQNSLEVDEWYKKRVEWAEINNIILHATEGPCDIQEELVNTQEFTEG